MSYRELLTPHMAEYQEKFTDAGDVRWLPYLMYFHPLNYRSAVVNTDSSGFRYSEYGGARYAVGDYNDKSPVRLLAGSSTAFGIGASSDRWTLASCLSEHDSRGSPWLNLGGRSFNSPQELMLMMLYRHRLPHVKEIVLFSGFNNLGLARLPKGLRGEHGAFFNCNQFLSAMRRPEKTESWIWSRLFKRSASADKIDPNVQTMSEQIDYATELTLRHLQVWKILAAEMNAKLTFVLQPLAGWVRAMGCKEEECLFAELEAKGHFTDTYGDILNCEVLYQYASLLESGTRTMGVEFVNLSPLISATVKPDQWLFVDRIHFTDAGHDYVAKLLLNHIH